MGAPRLRRAIEVDQPRALVLLVHGGLVRSKLAVPDQNLSIAWPHIKWLQDKVSLRFAARGVEVWALIHRYAGWNSDTHPSPVPDLEWALSEARTRHPGVPVILVGHSMGARTSLRVAHDPTVAGLVALCPWYPEDEVLPPPGMPLRVAFATWDWECPYPSMRTFLHRARDHDADVRVESMGRDLHYMLRSRRWESYVLRTVTDLVQSVEAPVTVSP
jgi:alpha-beta hydrolase superfamily lysophospholipase